MRGSFLCRARCARTSLLPSFAFALLAGAAAVPLWAQERAVITGRVTDVAERPVGSAQVFMPEYLAGTLTRSDGAYTLSVPAARIRDRPVVLRVSSIGYRTASVEIDLRSGDRHVQDFRLQPDPIRLDEIVATGQGLQRLRRRLGSTLSTVTSEEVVSSGEANLVAALAGKAANVEVTRSAGEPAGGAYIRIRGSNTLSGTNQPLFVVDGTPVSNASKHIEEGLWGTAVQNRAADINLEDIESIEILKGPAASAIYGAAGANGAVLIRTRSGRRGEGSRATLKLSSSLDDVNGLPELQRQYGQGLNLAPLGLEGTDPSSVSWGAPLPCQPTCRLGVDVFDHASELFESGTRLGGDLTLAGGADRTTWYLGGGWSTHDGVVVGPNSRLDRATARLKGSHMLADNLTAAGNFAYTKQRGGLIQQGSALSALLLGAFRTPPEFNNCRPDSDPCYIHPETGLHFSYRNPNPNSLAEGRGYDNPFWVAHEIPSRTEVDRTFGNVQLDYQPFEWLDVQYTLGADYYTDQRLSVWPKSSSDFPDGAMIRADLSEFNVDHSLLATATHTFGPAVIGSLTVGQNLRHEQFTRYQVFGYDLIFGTDQLDFTVDRFPDEFESIVRTEGYFASAEVDLYDQLFLSGTLRVDASSTFGGEDVRRFFYPQASLAWEFTQLEAFRDRGVLDYAKLRVAFGAAGKAPPVYSNVSAFRTIEAYGLAASYAGFQGLITSAAAGNPDIEPERTWELEGGLDATWLGGRVGLGATYYYQKTEDAILFLSVPPSSGFLTQPQNGAEYENRGFELTAEVTPLRTRHVRWDVGAQWAANRSEVLNLLSGEEFYLAGFGATRVSVVKDLCGATAKEPCPFGVLMGGDFVRFGRGSTVDDVPIDQAVSGWRPGDLYIGEDGFPLLDLQDRVIGDPNPDWTGSLRTSLTFLDNLRFSALIDVRKGGDMWNGTKGALFTFGTHAHTLPMHGTGGRHVFGCGEPSRGEVRTCADPSGVAGPGVGREVALDWSTWTVLGIGGGFTGPGSQFVEDAGFVKLRDLSVSYALEGEWVRKIGGARRIEVSAAGRNLVTWTDYTGIDPESNLTGQSTGRGLDYFNNPQTRSFVLQMRIAR